MSPNNVTIIPNESKTAEALEIIKEEQASSPTSSSKPIDGSKLDADQFQKDLIKCICKKDDEASKVKIAPSHVEEILKEKEIELREEYEKILKREKELIKDRFNFILLNEQTRSAYMLREAHRERQERIHALQTQLQCKNLAALMYVMCTERRRSRMEKLKIIEDYTNYINALHDILSRGQDLILHLSRGYKTVARVDHEWREKMKSVVSEFMAFIYNFSGGDPETNQYLIDLPKLLTTKTPIAIDPDEDPCDCDQDEDKEEDSSLNETFTEPIHGKVWWQDMDKENHPFIMFGDMCDFNPDRRHEVLMKIKAQRVRAAKTAPKEWKELAFNDMYLKSKCVHLNKIKNIYPDKLPVPVKWECVHSPTKRTSKMSISNAARAGSVDFRGAMSSILKIITSVPNTAPVPAKTELLGARDSMEITSTTKLRYSIKPDDDSNAEQNKIILNIGSKRVSVFQEYDDEDDSAYQQTQNETAALSAPNEEDVKTDESPTQSMLGSCHNDSIQGIQPHEPDHDHFINYERVCPMEKCKRLQVDSFMRSLPPYMRANPSTQFEQTFDEYETCTPEQLELLKQRIEHKRHKDSKDEEIEKESDPESLLSEWRSTGVAVQTSDLNILPPCTCRPDTPKSSVSSDFIFNVADLEPVKLAMDAIHRECFFDDRVEFDRFKLIGQEMNNKDPKQKQQDNEFRQSRYQEISEILNKHPSLLDIFQATAR